MSEELRTLQVTTDTSGVANNESSPPTLVLNEWSDHPIVRNANVVFSKGHVARWVVPIDTGSPEGHTANGISEGGNHATDRTLFWSGVGHTASHLAYTGAGVVTDEFRKDMANDAYIEEMARGVSRNQIARGVQLLVDANAESHNVGATATKATIGAAMATIADSAFNGRTAFYADLFSWSEAFVALGADVNTNIKTRGDGLLGFYAGYPVWQVHHFAPAPTKMCYFGDLKSSVGVSFGEQRVKWFERPASDEWLVNSIIRAGLVWIGTRANANNMPLSNSKHMVKLNFA